MPDHEAPATFASMPEPAEAILVVSHTFPPYRGIGGRRWAKFAKELARQGHPIHVICSAGGQRLQGSLWTADRETPGVTVHELPQRYPTVLFKRPLRGALEKLAYRAWALVLPLLVKGNWLDKTVFWRRRFLRTASDLITSQGIRTVIVSGAPFRLLGYGVELKRKHGIRLITDLRDPWTWHGGYGFDTLPPDRQRWERELERMVMEDADAVVSPHPSVIGHLTRAYPEGTARFSVLPHAIDPDELGQPRAPRKDGEYRLIYAGSLYGAGEAVAYFEALLQAFDRLRSQAPERYATTFLDLHITGHGTSELAERTRAAGHEAHIRFRPPLPPREVFERIGTSDAVLIFIPSFNKDLLGTKFTEIFYLRRPVIHVGVPGAVSRYIEEHGLGISIPVDELSDTLPRIANGERRLTVDPGYDPSPHLLANITARFRSEVLSDAPPA